MHRILTLLIVLLITSSVTNAQFSEGRIFAGPTVGLMSFQTSLGYGAMGEYAVNDNWGAGLSIGYSSFRIDFPGSGETGQDLPYFDYKLISILGFASYHFMPNKKFDPFVSAGIGYLNWDVKYVDNNGSSGLPGFSAAYSSGIGFTAAANARYHFSDVVSGRLSVGFPFLVGAGVDIGFGAPVKTGEGDSVVTSKPVAADTAPKKDYPLYIGAYINGKTSIKTEVPEGWKTGIVVNTPPDFGISIMAPFGKETNIGFALDLGSASYGYIMKPEKNANDSNTIEERFQFFNVFPHLNIAGFIIGVNFGFKSNYTTKFVSGDTASMVGEYTVRPREDMSDTTTIQPDPIGTQFGTTYDPTKYVSDMIEIRIGGSIPIVTSDIGRLAINVMAGYTLTQMFTNYRNYVGSYPLEADPTNKFLQRGQPQESLNPVIPSLSVGLQWDFKIGL